MASHQQYAIAFGTARAIRLPVTSGRSAQWALAKNKNRTVYNCILHRLYSRCQRATAIKAWRMSRPPWYAGFGVFAEATDMVEDEGWYFQNFV